ncbi:MAG: cob(I)yrinic acid a,c-diamide adenosyltransferase [Akkermansiaceae bacterium]
MSIITRRGDDGNTDVMYGGRMAKTSPEVVACGCVDELNAALGMVRVSGLSDDMVKNIDTIQGHLVSLMGLLSVPADKREKYLSDGYPAISQDDLDWLESIAEEMPTKFDGWARPGAAGDQSAAWMDVARTICRRAELSAWDMGEGACAEACRFLNRLSDILWLWARKLESDAAV